MNLISNLSSVCWWAPLLAGILAYVVGGLWYSPMLFSKPWMKAVGTTEAELMKGKPAVVFGTTALLTVVQAYAFAAVLGPAPGLVNGFVAGVFVGLLLSLPTLAIVALFERRPSTLILINGGHEAAKFAVLGLLLGWLA